MAVSEQISDGLWDEFHTVVNMTSRELQEWLNVESAGEETEEVPDRAGKPMGRRVLEILGKRRTDLTQDDVSVMQRVCDIVRSQRDPPSTRRPGNRLAPRPDGHRSRPLKPT